MNLIYEPILITLYKKINRLFTKNFKFVYAVNDNLDHFTLFKLIR